MTRVAIGSITGSSAARVDNRPNMRGGVTVDRNLPVGTKLWLAAWSKRIAGADYISISAEIAIGGPRKRSKDEVGSSPARFTRANVARTIHKAKNAMHRLFEVSAISVERYGSPCRTTLVVPT